MIEKTHPLMFFRFLKPYSFVLILPFLRLLLKFGFQVILSGMFLFETAVFLVVILLAFLKWRFYRFYKKTDGFLLCYGIFIKREIYIPFVRIASIYERQNLIERIFSARSVFISTDAKGKKADIRVCLKETVSCELFADKSLQNRHKIKRYKFKKIVLWAAVSGGAFSGAFIFVPIISKTAELLGIGVYELLIRRIAANTEILGSYMPKAANVAIFILLGFYVTAFVYRIFKGFGFSVALGQKDIEISNGIIAKYRTHFKRSEIKGLISEQPLLMCVLGLFTLKASVGGCDSKKLFGNSIIVPIFSKKRVDRHIFELTGEFESNATLSKAIARKGVISAITPAMLLMLALFLSALYLFFLLENFRRFIVFLAIIAFLGVLWWADLLIYSYKRGGLIFSKKITAKGTIGLKRKTVCSDFEDIGLIKLIESPFDRRRGSSKATITLFSKNADRVRVKWLKRDELLNIFLKRYNPKQK
ncbi:MAG: hypothetical protein E7565_08360 [Ruminococcaceae bacterium]|nr:hypothetical protein [Oscillospiraceae bacterium]